MQGLIIILAVMIGYILGRYSRPEDKIARAAGVINAIIGAGEKIKVFKKKIPITKEEETINQLDNEQHQA